jgi:phosphoadenosine phosphosulfate reductase
VILVDKRSRFAYSGGMNTHTDSLLPGYEPSEQDLVNRALAQPLEKKIARAIALLRHWEPEALKLDPRGYWVADSFGKDSDCIVELAKMAGVAHHCEHNLTTIDPPELIWYGKRTRPETHINKPEMPMLRMLSTKGKGPPLRMARWCCEVYKEHGGQHAAKVIGIRIAESVNRAARWSEFVRHTGSKTGFVLCPIAYWSDADVWEFHGRQKIPHCSLYDEGFKRLGCIGCPLSSNQCKEFMRWPKYEAMWRKSFDDLWNNFAHKPNKHGLPRSWVKYGSPEGFWKWWTTTCQGDGPACQGAELFSAHELGDENADE